MSKNQNFLHRMPNGKNIVVEKLFIVVPRYERRDTSDERIVRQLSKVFDKFTLFMQNKANPSTTLRTGLFVMRTAWCVLRKEFEKTKPIFAGINECKCIYDRWLRQYSGVLPAKKQSQFKANPSTHSTSLRNCRTGFVSRGHCPRLCLWWMNDLPVSGLVKNVRFKTPVIIQKDPLLKMLIWARQKNQIRWEQRK